MAFVTTHGPILAERSRMSKANSGDFDWRTASFFAASGMGGALIGAKFTHLVSAAVLLLLFGTLMLVVGTGMLRHGETKTASHECRPARCLATGAAVGALTGFLGVGGL